MEGTGGSNAGWMARWSLKVGSDDGKESEWCVRLLYRRVGKSAGLFGLWKPPAIHSSGSRHTWSWGIIWPFCFLSLSQPPSVLRRKITSLPFDHRFTALLFVPTGIWAMTLFGFGNAVPKKWSFTPSEVVFPTSSSGKSLIHWMAPDPWKNFILN